MHVFETPSHMHIRSASQLDCAASFRHDWEHLFVAGFQSQFGSCEHAALELCWNWHCWTHLPVSELYMHIDTERHELLSPC